MLKSKRNPVRYEIRVVLKDIEPAIWRQVVVRSDLTLRTLHHVLQVAMGWTNSHLHHFTFKNKIYGRPDPEYADFDMKVFDDTKVRLEDLVTDRGQCLTYEYDLGDSWEHFLTIEGILPIDEDKTPALCVGGVRACPPEDVGGTGGYEEFLNAVRHPNHAEHKRLLRWVGGAFDPEAFDLNQVNRKLQGLLTRPRPPRESSLA